MEVGFLLAGKYRVSKGGGVVSSGKSVVLQGETTDMNCTELALKYRPNGSAESREAYEQERRFLILFRGSRVVVTLWETVVLEGYWVLVLERGVCNLAEHVVHMQQNPDVNELMKRTLLKQIIQVRVSCSTQC